MIKYIKYLYNDVLSYNEENHVFTASHLYLSDHHNLFNIITSNCESCNHYYKKIVKYCLFPKKIIKTVDKYDKFEGSMKKFFEYLYKLECECCMSKMNEYCGCLICVEYQNKSIIKKCINCNKVFMAYTIKVNNLETPISIIYCVVCNYLKQVKYPRESDEYKLYCSNKNSAGNVKKCQISNQKNNINSVGNINKIYSISNGINNISSSISSGSSSSSSININNNNNNCGCLSPFK